MKKLTLLYPPLHIPNVNYTIQSELFYFSTSRKLNQHRGNIKGKTWLEIRVSV